MWDRYPRVRLTVILVLAAVALVLGATRLGDAVQMSRFGHVATAEVLDVDLHSRGGNEVYVQYTVDRVVYRGSVEELWTAPERGESVEIIYDTRDPAHITDAPLAWGYGTGSVGVAAGLVALTWAGRELRRRRGSQWLPD